MKMNKQLLLLLIGVVVIVAGLAFATTNIVDALFPAPVSVNPTQKLSETKSVSDNMQLVVAGIPRVFANGDEVPLVGDVVAKINVERGDERYWRRIDLFLYHQTTSAPADDVTVQVKGEMVYMDHGTFRSVPVESDGGHYILSLPFVMSGEWQVKVQMNISGKQTELQLQMDVFD